MLHRVAVADQAEARARWAGTTIRSRQTTISCASTMMTPAEAFLGERQRVDEWLAVDLDRHAGLARLDLHRSTAIHHRQERIA